jgi:hypothetical protein
MRKMWFWRCSCGSVVRAVIQFDAADLLQNEAASCPTCMKKQPVDGQVVELLVVYHPADQTQHEPVS